MIKVVILMSELHSHMKKHKTGFKDIKDSNMIDEVVRHITKKDLKDVMKTA